MGEGRLIVLIRTLVAMATYSFYRIVIRLISLILCIYVYDIGLNIFLFPSEKWKMTIVSVSMGKFEFAFTEMYTEKSYTFSMTFNQIDDFDWLPGKFSRNKIFLSETIRWM